MESNIVREFEALTVYGQGRNGGQGVLMGDLVADLTLALEESGATANAAVEDLQNGEDVKILSVAGKGPLRDRSL